MQLDVENIKIWNYMAFTDVTIDKKNRGAIK